MSEENNKVNCYSQNSSSVPIKGELTDLLTEIVFILCFNISFLKKILLFNGQIFVSKFTNSPALIQRLSCFDCKVHGILVKRLFQIMSIKLF